MPKALREGPIARHHRADWSILDNKARNHELIARLNKTSGGDVGQPGGGRSAEIEGIHHPQANGVPRPRTTAV